MTKIILSPWVNGLGDNLAISTLPERYVREFGAEVYIRNNVRNSEILDLVWRTNPFVSGITEEHANIVTPSDEQQRQGCVVYGCVVTAIEAAMGFAAPYNKYPRIYYQPKYNKDLREYSIIDSASVTCKITKESYYPYIDYLIERNYIDINKCLFLDTGIVDHIRDFYPDMPRLRPNNIFETTDAIYSCKNFITVQSGLAGIACAIKGDKPFPKVHALIAQAIYNNKVWVYPNINYYVTGELKKDFEFV